MDKLLKIEEVAMMIGVSSQTINNWYRFKKLHPENELASILPDFYQEKPRQIRYWQKSDIWALVEFKNKLPHGRNGILGEVTQHGKYKGGRSKCQD